MNQCAALMDAACIHTLIQSIYTSIKHDTEGHVSLVECAALMLVYVREWMRRSQAPRIKTQVKKTSSACATRRRESLPQTVCVAWLIAMRLGLNNLI